MYIHSFGVAKTWKPHIELTAVHTPLSYKTWKLIIRYKELQFAFSQTYWVHLIELAPKSVLIQNVGHLTPFTISHTIYWNNLNCMQRVNKSQLKGDSFLPNNTLENWTKQLTLPIHYTHKRKRSHHHSLTDLHEAKSVIKNRGFHA